MSHRNVTRRRVVAPATGEVITKQYPKDECDINNILSQYKKTGIINHINSNRGEYIDLPSSPDYQSALNLALEAQNAFSTLPAVVRERFRNDPKYLLAALQDLNMRPELEQLGIINPKPAPAPASPASSPVNPPIVPASAE